MSSAIGKTTIIWVATGLAATIFYFDTFVPLGVAGCVPYVLVVLASLLLPYPSAPVVAAIVCTGLTYLSIGFLPDGSDWGKIFLNRSLAVFAIWATAILGLRLKREKEQVREGHESFQLAMEATNEGTWDWDLRTNHVTFSEAWCKSLGFQPNEIEPHLRSWENLVHPEDMPHARQQLQAHLKGTTSAYECENRLKTKSGTWRWNINRGKVVARDETGKPLRMVGVDIDISDRKQAEQRESLQKSVLEKIVVGKHSQADILNELCVQVERMIPSSICSIMLLDENTGILKVGAVPSGGQTACAILDGLVPGQFAGACGTAAHTGETVIIEDTETDPRWEPIREAARSLGIKSCWSIPLFTEGKHILGTFAISHAQFRRPTAQDYQLLETASYLASIAIKRTSDLEQLQDREVRFRDLFESAPLAYFTSHMDGRIKSVNHRAVQLVGYSPEELKGRVVVDLYAPTKNGRAKAQQLHIQAQKGQEIEGEELEMQRSDGKHVWVNLTVRIIRDEKGNPIERRGMVEDITDRKRAEILLERQNSILEMISRKTALPEVLTQICHLVENQSDQMYCSVHLLEGTVLRNGAAPSLPDAYIQRLDGIPIGPCAGSCGTAAYRKEPVIVADIATDPLWERGRRLALKHELRACWSTPIRSSRDTVLGTFAMYYPRPRTPDSESYKLIDIATNLAGIAIEQRRGEEALQNSEGRFRSLYEDNPTMYFTVSSDGTILSVNQFGALQLGYEPEDLIGKPVVSIFHEEDKPKVLSEFQKSLHNQTNIASWEFRKVRNDGRLIWVKETTRVIENIDGEPVALIVCEDITSRKRTEQLQTLQQSTLELMVTGAALSEILDALCRQVETMLPSAVCSILTLDSTAQCLKFQAGPSVPPPLAAALDGMIPGPCAGSCGTATFRGEPVYVSNTGTDPLWAHLQDAAKQFNIGACWSFPIYAEEKHILGSFAISSPHPRSPTSLDIQILETVSYLAGIAIRRRETEEALTESEQRYRTLYEDNPSMYFTVSSEGTILSVNEFGASQLGYTVQELLGKPASMLFVEDDQVAVKKKLEECLESPKDLGHWEFRKIRKDRRVIWVRETVRVVRHEANQAVFLIVCDDITEQKQADQRIAENDQAIRELYEITSSPNRSFEHRVRALLTLGCRRFKLPTGLLTHRINEELELQLVSSPDPMFKEGARVPLCNTFCSTAMVSDTPICFEQASRSEWKNHPGYTELQLESYLGTKVLAGNEPYGTFCFTGPEPYPGTFSEADQDFLQLMARWIGTELEGLKAETDLRESHALMNAVLEGTTDAFFVKDLEGRYLMMNVACRRMLKKSDQELIGKTDEEIFPVDTALSIKKQDKEILQAGTTHTFEEELVTNRMKRTLLTTKGPYRDAEGNVVGLFGNARDISQRKQAEEKMKEINVALSNAMPGISQVNLEGCYLEVNDQYAALLGYTPEELLGKTWEPTVHPDDLPSASSAYQAMLQTGKGEFEAKAVRKDGTTFYKHVLMVKKTDQDGEAIGHHCFMRDITERRSSDDALKESEGRLQAILDNSSAVIYVKDLQGKYLLINRKFETLFNVNRENLKDKTDFDLFPFDIAKSFTENDKKVLELGSPMAWEEVAPHEDGLHTYLSNKFPLRNANGDPYAMCGISTDIHQRKQAENSIRLHTRILESSPNGILITDAQLPDNPIIYCNRAFEEMTGFTQAEILGKNCRFLQGPDTNQENLSTLRTALAAHQPCQVMLRNYKKDGTLIWNDLRLAPVFNEQGKLINYIGVQIDVTERKSVEDALRALAEAAATLTGLEFVRFVVKTLAQCLNVKYAFMTECTDASKQKLRTLAFWSGPAFGENFEYQISGTPCAEVMKGEICHFPHSVQHHFPDDQDLKTLEVESYVGFPLFSQSGEIFGHLVAMDTQSLSENSQSIPILKLFAARAAAELERNKAERALRRSEERLRQVIDLVPHFIFAKDTDGHFILANDAVATVYGTTVSSLLGKSDSDFAQSKEEVDQFRKDDLEVIEKKKTKVIKEEQITDATGNLRYLHTTKIPFVFADSTLPAILGVSTDITERKMAESQLQEAYERTRELSVRLEAAEEAERKRIARELHDEFGQMLTGLKFDLSWVQRRLSEQSSVVPYNVLIEKTRSMTKLTDNLIQTVRRIATSLRPSILDDLGLIPALEWQAKDFQKRTGIQCQFTTEPDITNDSFDSDRATALFRIAQELCTNVLRYAEASRINLELRQEDHVVVLAVQDNGRGISEKEIGQPTSLGLLGIKERVAPFKGKFSIKGKAGKGTLATVKIPLP